MSNYNRNTPKFVDSHLDVREHTKSRESVEADLKVPDPKPDQAKAILDSKVQSYLRAFARLVSAQPGTPDFDIEQASLDAAWDSLTIEEKSLAYEQAEPYRKRLSS